MKILIFFLIIFFPTNIFAEKLSTDILKNYIEEINSFYGKFYQLENNKLSSGEIFYSNNRLRVEYIDPTNILFVLKKNKVMYYNKELEEVQYFNPKNTSAEIFMNLFSDINFFDQTNLSAHKGYLVLRKNVNVEKQPYELKVYFENKPILLRKIELIGDNSTILFSFSEINFNPILDKSLFSLANPLLK